MKIIKLTAENIKKLICVEITPSGNLVEITGANGSGKTSVLDSIYWLLAGTKDIDKQPIRRGASEAIIQADLGDLKVTRRLSATGTSLVVERADGTRLEKPQSILDRLIGKIAFDPLAFSRMKPKEQFEQLRKLVKLDIDIDKLDELNASDFAKRTDLNRKAKETRAQAEGIRVPPGVPLDPIDITELSGQIERAVQHNADIERELAHRRDIATQIATLHKRASDNRRKADQLRLQIKEEMDEAESREALADSLTNEMREKPPIPSPIDVAAEKAKISAAIATNENVRAAAHARALLDGVARAEEEAEKLTAVIADREAKKRHAIAAAKMPVAGLGFGKDEVLLNDLPFEQASDAEQLRASCAIAMAMNPELRVLRVRDGSLLDENGLRLLGEMATAADYQVWIERVDDSGTVGIVLEEGRIKHKDVEAPHLFSNSVGAGNG